MIAKEKISQDMLHSLEAKCKAEYKIVNSRVKVEDLSTPYYEFYNAIVGNDLSSPLNLFVECLIKADVTCKDVKSILNEDRYRWISAFVKDNCYYDSINLKYQLLERGYDNSIEPIVEQAVEQILPKLYDSLNVELLFSDNNYNYSIKLSERIKEQAMEYFLDVSGEPYNDENDDDRELMNLIVSTLEFRVIRFAKIVLLLNISIEFKESMLSVIDLDKISNSKYGPVYGKHLENDIHAAEPKGQCFSLSKDLLSIIDNPRDFAKHIKFSNSNLEKVRHSFL